MSIKRSFLGRESLGTLKTVARCSMWRMPGWEESEEAPMSWLTSWLSHRVLKRRVWWEPFMASGWWMMMPRAVRRNWVADWSVELKVLVEKERTGGVEERRRWRPGSGRKGLAGSKDCRRAP